MPTVKKKSVRRVAVKPTESVKLDAALKCSRCDGYNWLYSVTKGTGMDLVSDTITPDVTHNEEFRCKTCGKNANNVNTKALRSSSLFATIVSQNGHKG